MAKKTAVNNPDAICLSRQLNEFGTCNESCPERGKVSGCTFVEDKEEPQKSN